MPVVPFVENQIAYPPPQGAPLNPEAASQGAEAIARGGQFASEEMARFAERYGEQQRATQAADTMVGAQNDLQAVAQKWSKTPNMAQAVAGFNDDANQIQTRTLAGIQDPQVKGLVSRQFDEARIAHSWNVRQQSFGLESSAQRGALDVQLAGLAQQAATAPTPEQRAQILDMASMAIKSRAPMYLTPEEADKTTIQFRSDVQKVQALDFIQRASQGPNVTHLSPLAISNAILDPNNFQGLLPGERQQLADEAVRLGRTMVAMRMADDAHNEAVADKAQKAAQAANAADMIGTVNQTPPGADLPFKIDDLTRAVRTQQLSGAGYSAVLTAMQRRSAGADDPTVAMDLWRRARLGEDVSHDALQAYADGKLKNETAIDIGKLVASRGTGETAPDKANFATLKTALNGYAIEQGIFAGADKAEKAQLWTAAQAEWTKRVLLGHENSSAVLGDMLQRYVKAPVAPDGLPTPRMGAVSSLADVTGVWARTKAAHDAGKMDDATFQSEADLLDRYRAAYTAAAATRAPKATAGGAQPLGPSGDMNQ